MSPLIIMISNIGIFQLLIKIFGVNNSIQPENSLVIRGLNLEPSVVNNYDINRVLHSQDDHKISSQHHEQLAITPHPPQTRESDSDLFLYKNDSHTLPCFSECFINENSSKNVHHSSLPSVNFDNPLTEGTNTTISQSHKQYLENTEVYHVYSSTGDVNLDLRIQELNSIIPDVAIFQQILRNNESRTSKLDISLPTNDVSGSTDFYENLSNICAIGLCSGSSLTDCRETEYRPSKQNHKAFPVRILSKFDAILSKFDAFFYVIFESYIDMTNNSLMNIVIHVRRLTCRLYMNYKPTCTATQYFLFGYGAQNRSLSGGSINVLMPRVFKSIKNYDQEIEINNTQIISQTEDYFDLAVHTCVNRRRVSIRRPETRSISFCFDTCLKTFLKSDFVALDGDRMLLFRFYSSCFGKLRYKIDYNMKESQMADIISKNSDSRIAHKNCGDMPTDIQIISRYTRKSFVHHYMSYNMLQELKQKV